MKGKCSMKYQMRLQPSSFFYYGCCFCLFYLFYFALSSTPSLLLAYSPPLYCSLF